MDLLSKEVITAVTTAEPREPSAVVVRSQEGAASKAVTTTQTKAAAQAPQQRPPLLSTMRVRATTMITKMRTQARIQAPKLSSTTKEKRSTTTRVRPTQSRRTPRHPRLSSTTTAGLVDSEAGRAHPEEVSRAADRPLLIGAEDTPEEVATTEARALGPTPTEV